MCIYVQVDVYTFSLLQYNTAVAGAVAGGCVFFFCSSRFPLFSCPCPEIYGWTYVPPAGLNGFTTSYHLFEIVKFVVLDVLSFSPVFPDTRQRAFSLP